MFYTYMHLRASDNKVFYVGKGQGQRAYKSFGRNLHWKSTVANHGLKVEVCAQWSTEQEAFDHETFLIECFRDMGAPLTNMTDGGEGASGCVPSEETKQKLSSASKIAHSRPGAKEKMSAALKAACARPGVKEKMSASAKSALSDPEVRAKMSATSKANQACPEVKAKISASRKASNARPDVKAKLSAAAKLHWQDPAFRTKMAASKAAKKVAI